MKNIYYSIERTNGKYVVWKNVEIKKEQKGSYGSYKKFSGTLKQCKDYAKKHRLRIKRNSTLILQLARS